MSYLLCAVLGYLSGSVLYSYYLPLWIKGIDVTEGTSDGNPGAFNCIHRAGWAIGLLALACDFFKGLVPVLVAARALETDCWAFALVVAAPAAGHAWPLFRRFRGGKAITTSFGAAAGLLPVWEPVVILAACYLFFSLVVQLEPHRFRSIVAYCCFGAGTMARLGTRAMGLGCLLMAAVVIVRHLPPEPGEERPQARLRLRREE